MPCNQIDRDIIERFLAQGLGETADFDAFWGYFVAALSREMNRWPSVPASLDLKSRLAAYLFTSWMRNFYGGSADGFYWQSGPLREAAFQFARQSGLHCLPVHFYSPVPDAEQLPDALFSRCSSLPGVQMNVEQQRRLITQLAASFREEYEKFPEEKPVGAPSHFYFTSNGYFGNVDGQLLYSLIRRFQPRKILEIGGGFSTFLSAQALLENGRKRATGHSSELVTIEPFPCDALRAGFPGLSRLIASPVQHGPLAVFESLAANDILFIDSSHVLKLGSDVHYEFLEILPRLRPGVLIHVHDIFLPREYPRAWILDMHRYWTEQYLLQAFLAFNSEFEVLLSPAYLHFHYPEILESAFGVYHRDVPWIPSSFWLRRRDSSGVA